MKNPRLLFAGGILLLSALLLIPLKVRQDRKREANGSTLTASTLQSVTAISAGHHSSNPLPPPAAALQDAVGRFDAWARAYSANGAVASATLAEGINLARERREQMAALIQNNPRAALSQAVPYSLRRRLPAAVTDLLERPVSGRGDFQVLAATPEPGRSGTTATSRFLVVDGVRFNAYVYGRRSSQITRENIPVHGIELLGSVAVAEDPVRVLEPEEVKDRGLGIPREAVCGQSGLLAASGPSPALVEYGKQLIPVCNSSHAILLSQRLAASEGNFSAAVDFKPPDSISAISKGTKRVLFMRATFADDHSEPISFGEATTLMDTVSQYFLEASYNTTHLIPTITPILQLPQVRRWYGAQGPQALLDDARVAAKLAGFAPENYDLDVVRHQNVPEFTWGGLAYVGGRGAWLQSSAFPTAAHELGHNLGLWHANFWRTDRGPISVNYPDNPENLPYDPDAVVGHASIFGPGGDMEYGNPFDIMGLGQYHYAAPAKFALNWLPESFVTNVTSSSTVRLYPMDASVLSTGRVYAAAIRKDAERTYWLDYRSLSQNRWNDNGVELHWSRWSQTIGTAQLLDTTPGSINGRDDSALVVGRTFTDPSANVRITPVAIAREGENSYVDVVVTLGTNGLNAAPSVRILDAPESVNVDETVTFHTSGFDPDGDTLAYHWDFGDNSIAPNDAQTSHSWSTAGDYVVRLEVSDMKGGIDSTYVVVRVGNVTGFRISGRVTDQSGNPIQGVLVHNGMADTAQGFGTNYQSAYTDSQGRYTLANLQPGSYTNYAFLFGYVAHPLNFLNPIEVVGADTTGADFFVNALPVVSVTTNSIATRGVANSGVFTISRTGETNQALAVAFKMNGEAVVSNDFKLTNQIVLLTNYVSSAVLAITTNSFPMYVAVIPAGQTSVETRIDPLNDGNSVGTLFSTLTLMDAVQTLKTLTDTNLTNGYFIPGWKEGVVNGSRMMVATDPDYILGSPAEATLKILDPVPPGKPIVSIYALDSVANESGHGYALVTLLREGPIDSAITVGLKTVGALIADRDYISLPATVEMPAGKRYVNIPIRVIDNLFVKQDQRLRVFILPAESYTIGNGSVDIEVLSNDLPLVHVNAPEPVVGAGNPVGRFLITRLGDNSESLAVNYIVGGTAASGTNFAPLSGTATIPAGSATTTVDVTPLPNPPTSGDRLLTLQLAPRPNYNITFPHAATITIQDPKLPTVTVTLDPNANTVTEGGTDGNFIITRTGPGLNQNLTVRFEVSGSAIPLLDYAAIGNSVVIPAGQASVTIPVHALVDNYQEIAKEVVLLLLPDSHYNIGRSYQAVMPFAQDTGGSQPYVTFSLQSSSGPSTLAEPLITVEVSKEPVQGTPVTVDYRVTGGTAVSGVHYQMAAGQIQFIAGQPTLQQIPLTILTNGTFGGSKSLFITLFDPTPIYTNLVQNGETNTILLDPTNAVIAPYRTHAYTIFDDDAAAVTVTAPEPVASEAEARIGLFRISRSGITNNFPVEVNFQISGTATPGSDYVPLTNRVVIPAGSNSVDLKVVPLKDPTADLREYVSLLLTKASNAFIADPNVAVVEIQNNVGTIEFTNIHYRAGEDYGTAQIPVRRTGDLSQRDTVEFFLSGGTAVDGVDYVSTNSTLVFEPGEKLKTVEVTILTNTAGFENTWVQLNLTKPTGGLPLAGQNRALLEIINIHSGIRFGAPIYSSYEFNGYANMLISRIGVLTNRLTLNFATVDDSGIAGIRYQPTLGIITFAEGESLQSLSVPLIDNTDIDGDPLFQVALSEPSDPNAVLLEISGLAQIIDDDCEIEFDTAATVVNEYDGTVRIGVHRRGGTGNQVSVQFNTVDGTAIAGVKYVADSGLVTFGSDRLTPGPLGLTLSPGESNKTFTVQLLDNDLGEGRQSFTVDLSSVQNFNPRAMVGSARLGVGASTTITIIDDESPGGTDTTFVPGTGANGPIYTLDLQPDGNVLAGGDFITMDELTMNRIARLHGNGFLDRSFDPGLGANGPVRTVLRQPDGKVVIGGNFTRVRNATQPYLGRFTADGQLDIDFLSSGADGPVYALALQTNGNLLVGGDFSQVSDSNARRLVQLDSFGLPDPFFTIGNGPSGPVRALAVTEDGRIYVGGLFSRFNGVTTPNLVRLLPDGSRDEAFNAGNGPNGIVRVIHVLPDGDLLIGGSFTEVNGVPLRNLARLTPEGAVDPSFLPGQGPDGAVNAIAADGSGKIWIGGEFQHIDTVEVNRIARLNADGGLDADFEPRQGANGTVNAIVVQENSAVIIAGEFTEVNNLPRNRIARLHGEEKFAGGIIQFTSARFEALRLTNIAWVSVERHGIVTNAATVDFETLDGTAVADIDYTATNFTLAFAPGETNKTFPIQLIPGGPTEGDLTVNLRLKNPSPSTGLSRGAAKLILVDPRDKILFGNDRYSIRESDGPLTVTVLRRGTLSGVATVSYGIENETASGEDYAFGSGTLRFEAGETNKTLVIPIVNDELNETNETFVVVLSNADGAVLGDPSRATVTIVDDDNLPKFRLTLTATGGTVTPSSGLYQSNSVQTLVATPDDGFAFVGWEGTVTSGQNPLRITMNRDYQLIAKFRTTRVTDGFETGNFRALPWQNDPNAPWFIQTNRVSRGRFAARSGAIGNSSQTSLILDTESPGGIGSFDLFVSSEPFWDALEFYLNGLRLQSWSDTGVWVSYQFRLLPGQNHLEWRYAKDPSFTGGLDAAFLDNVYLPPVPPPVVGDLHAHLTATFNGQGPVFTVSGATNQAYVIEVSADLVHWTPISTNVFVGQPLQVNDPAVSSTTTRFYRARTQ
jgi:uncharacterized delta-60 repeat protein